MVETQTKELCARLDERSIEYEQSCIEGIAEYTHVTKWKMQAGNRCTFCEIEDGYPPYFTRMFIETPTAAQVIAATVGRGNLTAEQVREAIMSADRWGKPMGDTGMTNTHLIIRDDGWQAIADKLNATVGAGTCHNISKVTDTSGRKVRFVCSECGAWIVSEFIWDYDASGESPWVQDCKLNYCPNCGKRIEASE